MIKLVFASSSSMLSILVSIGLFFLYLPMFKWCALLVAIITFSLLCSVKINQLFSSFSMKINWWSIDYFYLIGFDFFHSLNSSIYLFQVIGCYQLCWKTSISKKKSAAATGLNFLFFYFEALILYIWKMDEKTQIYGVII